MLAVGASASRADIEVNGTRATLRWAAASGPVSQYMVYVGRNGGGSRLESIVTTNQVTLTGAAGDVVVVSVAAVGYPNGAGTPYERGPISPSSDPIRFVAMLATTGVMVVDCIPCKRGELRRIGVGPAYLTFPHPSSGNWELQRVGSFEAGSLATQVLMREAASGALWLGKMSGTTLVPVASNSSSSLATMLPGAIEDLDGDGALEIALRDVVSGTVQIWGLVDGALKKRSSFLTTPSWWLIGAGDLDGDGQRDLWFDTRTGSVQVKYLNALQTDGKVNIPVALTGYTAYEVQDYDGDGLPDVLWRDTEGRMVLALLRGGASSPQVQLLPLPWEAMHRTSLPMTSANLDDVPGVEILVQNTATGTIDAVMPRKGGQRLRLIEPGAGWSLVQAAH